MGTGSLTSHLDVAQVTLYAFWIFFAGLIFYLRREDKREGYPLELERSEHIRVVGFPPMPDPKVYLLRDGSTVVTPRIEGIARPLNAAPVADWPGAPLQPLGNPMRDAVGPASYADRADVPDHTAEGDVRIVPLRTDHEFSVEERDPDPRGMEVLGADGRTGGIVRDVWVDRSEPQIRYLEVTVDTIEGTRNVLLPITFARIDGERRRIRVKSILAEQFADVPPLRDPDVVTLREEDQITAYYAGGHLYAEPRRLWPAL